MVKVKVELEFTKVQIAYLLCSGFEGGIGYWATLDYKNSTKPKSIDWASFLEKDDGVYTSFGNPKEEYKYIHWPLSEGGNLCIRTDDKIERKVNGVIVRPPSTKHYLNLETIREGMQLFADGCAYQFNNFRMDDGDACTGDVFIQYSLFGEVVYG